MSPGRLDGDGGANFDLQVPRMTDRLLAFRGSNKNDFNNSD